jgi:hypothetical protein
VEFNRRTLLGATIAGTAGAMLGSNVATADNPTLISERINLGRFLADADLVWQRMPKTWFEGAAWSFARWCTTSARS